MEMLRLKSALPLFLYVSFLMNISQAIDNKNITEETRHRLKHIIRYLQNNSAFYIIKEIFRSFDGPQFELNSVDTIQNQCNNDLKFIARGIEQGETWALKGKYVILVYINIYNMF